MRKIDKIIEGIRAQGVEVHPGTGGEGFTHSSCDKSMVWIGLPQSVLEPDPQAIRDEIEKVADFLDSKGHSGYVDGVCLIYNATEHSHLEDAVLEDAHERLKILAVILGYEG